MKMRIKGVIPVKKYTNAATGSCSYEKVFPTIGSPGNQSCSEYILVKFLLGH